jgi:hypothetical protein
MPAELRASGAAPVHAFAAAFDGKRVRVQAAGAGQETRRGKRGGEQARAPVQLFQQLVRRRLIF